MRPARKRGAGPGLEGKASREGGGARCASLPRAARGWHCRPPAGPAAALDGQCSCGARSRAWLGAAAAAATAVAAPHPSPRAGCLQSRPRGSARPPSPRLRLRRARPRLTRPPQLRLGAGRSGSLDAEPGKRRAAGSASGGGCGGGRRRRRGPGAGAGAAAAAPRARAAGERRASEEAPRIRSRGCPPGSPRVSPRAPARARRTAAPPGSIHGRQEAPCPDAGDSPGRRAQQPSPPPRSRRGHGRAEVRAGPRDPQSLLARWARSRGRARVRRRLERPSVPGLGATAVEPRGAARPRQMPPAKLEKKTSAPGRFGPLC